MLAAAVLFLTPMSFLDSETYSNTLMLIDKLALGLGLVLTPLFALAKFDLFALLVGDWPRARLPMSCIAWRGAQ